jgi:hypothetical protein
MSEEMININEEELINFIAKEEGLSHDVVEKVLLAEVRFLIEKGVIVEE